MLDQASPDGAVMRTSRGSKMWTVLAASGVLLRLLTRDRPSKPPIDRRHGMPEHPAAAASHDRSSSHASEPRSALEPTAASEPTPASEPTSPSEPTPASEPPPAFGSGDA